MASNTATPAEATESRGLFRRYLLAISENDVVKAVLSFGPSVGLVTVFYTLPLLVLLVYSFNTVSSLQTFEFTLQHWMLFFQPEQLFALEYQNLVYIRLLVKTIRVALIASAIAIVIAYPVTYYVGMKAPEKYKTALVILVIVPFWTSYLIRTYAWVPILSKGGFLNTMLGALGLGQVSILYTPLATQIGLVYVWIPFMILPLYASMESLSASYVEAAKDLGASRVQVFTNVILPLTWPGAAAGALFIFIKSAVAYITPELLGGSQGFLLASAIVNQFQGAYNWNFGSVLSFVLLLVVLAVLLLGRRYGLLSEADEMGGVI